MVEQESVILQIRIRLPIFFALYFEINLKASRLSLEDKIPRGNDFNSYNSLPSGTARQSFRVNLIASSALPPPWGTAQRLYRIVYQGHEVMK